MQPPLFHKQSVDEHFKENVKRNRYDLEEVDIGDITFLKGQNESVHRWYRLTPSFAPALVRYFLDYFEVENTSLVLDPFNGRGTTVIECQKAGIPAIGFEINPLLQRVAKYSLVWNQHHLEALSEFSDVLKCQILDSSNKSIEETIWTLSTSLPNIHDVFRWWRPTVLRDLLIARQLAGGQAFLPVKEYLWLAVNNASMDCANIHRNHPTITFDDGNDREISVLDAVSARLSELVDDLKTLSEKELVNNGLGQVELRNACQSLPHGHPCLGGVTTAITSPPYPNRYSYVHQTRPQLHFMQVISDRSEATDIDLLTVGGTWGRATSNLAKKLIVPGREILEILDYFPALREQSILMCNYATKYFLDLNSHIKELRRWAGHGFRGAYIVGNSRLKGVEVFTEAILARLFEMNGFTVEKILVFRKRGGRKRLYETAVIIRV